MKKFIFLFLLTLIGKPTYSQWTNTGNNNTTGTLFIGSSGTTVEKLRVSASGAQRSYGLFGATGSGNAGVLFDASNGDFAGSDYGGLYQNDSDLSFVLTNFGSNPIYFKTTNSNRMTILGNGDIGIGTTSPISKLDIQASSSNQDVLRLSHPTAPTAAGLSIGFGANGNGQANSSIDFKVQFSSTTYDVLAIDRTSRDFYYNGDGNVGIGTTSPDSKLSVNGTIHTKEVKVDLNGWSDFVFDDDYLLPTLKEIENYILENKHLPEIPSEEEVKKNGINLGEMDAKLLQKIEELTLYLIEQNKKIESQHVLIEKLQEEVSILKNE